MKVSRLDWENYIRRLRRINDAAANELLKWVEEWGRDAHGAMLFNLGDAIDAFDQTLIDAAYAVTQKYGDAAAALSAEMYDALAEFEGATVPMAEMAAAPSYGEVAKTVNGTLKRSQNPNELAGAVSRLVKRTGADTILMNAYRDRPKNRRGKRAASGAEFAWVPHGDTCAFCLMLASRGWQTQTVWAANSHAEHIHSNCDCTYAVRFDGKSEIEGYDPEEYRQIYENAEGNTPKEKINSMRRAQYAANKDEINAQKRAAYVRMKEIEGRKAEALSRFYVNREEVLYRNLQKVTPVFGYEDYAIHGVPEKSVVEYETTSGEITQYSAKELAEIITEDPGYQGGNIRLLSCGAGAGRNGFAQELANNIGKEVLAPTETLWVADNGELFISDNEILSDMWYNNGKIDNRIKPTGEWKLFAPQ